MSLSAEVAAGTEIPGGAGEKMETKTGSGVSPFELMLRSLSSSKKSQDGVHKSELLKRKETEIRSCVKVEVAVLGSPS